MEVTRTSPISGITRTKTFAITETQLNLYYQGYLKLQQAFPHLSASDREFIKTGIVDEEWDVATIPDENCF